MYCLVGNASGVLPGVAAGRIPEKFQVMGNGKGS